MHLCWCHHHHDVKTRKALKEPETSRRLDAVEEDEEDKVINHKLSGINFHFCGTYIK